jgi:hypothetical protein
VGCRPFFFVFVGSFLHKILNIPFYDSEGIKTNILILYSKTFSST